MDVSDTQSKQPQEETQGNNDANKAQQPEQPESQANAPAGQDQQNPAAAAAVAALAQLAQFGGTMSAEDRGKLELQLTQFAATLLAPQLMQYAPQAAGFSPRGGGGFGNRGRGRGRRGRGGFTYNRQPCPEPSASEALESNEVKEPSDNPEGETTTGFSNQTSAATGRNIPWCELCRVSCTSFEILEQQHKNGKKHQKNLQRSGDPNGVYLNSAVTPQPENVQEGEESKPTETEVINATVNQFDASQGTKRKLSGGGRGAKRANMRMREMEPPKPKVVIPLICDLCNVKCDTQEVFDRHLAGKKHISKLKRYEGHQAMYGPMGLQALYPPNPITQTLFNAQGPSMPSQAPTEVLAGTGEAPQAVGPNPSLGN